VGMDLIDRGEWSDDLIINLSYVAITRARELLYIPYLRETPLIKKTDFQTTQTLTTINKITC
jgi:hypothetical protein